MERPHGLSDSTWEDNLIVMVDLPPGHDLSRPQIYDDVYGMRLDDGAKPWPMYFDADADRWWSFSTPTEGPVDGLLWTIDLDSLWRKSKPKVPVYLRELYAQLRAAADRFGASISPEVTPDEAWKLVSRVQRRRRIRDRSFYVVVSAPDDEIYLIRDWWDALEAAGLEVGDGNMFWLYDGDWNELLCAEPYSVQAYFHEGDRSGNVGLPNVGIHFRIRDADDPVGRANLALDVAEKVADRLGANLVNTAGHPVDRETELEAVSAAAEAVKNALDLKTPPQPGEAT